MGGARGEAASARAENRRYTPAVLPRPSVVGGWCGVRAPRRALPVILMEQTPADARAAPSASGPTDMATENPPSPKRPRDPSSENKVSQRATTIDPVWPESQIRTTENLFSQHLPMHARALHIPPPLWVGGSKTTESQHNHISGRKAQTISHIPVSPEVDLLLCRQQQTMPPRGTKN
eukprot:scaffold17088_cov127-Isochrysis_galbana.AAC.3